MPKPQDKLSERGTKKITFYQVDDLQLTADDRAKLQGDPLGFLRELIENHGHKVNEIVGDPDKVREYLLQRADGEANVEAITDGQVCGVVHEEWPIHSRWFYACWPKAIWLMG